MARVKPRKFREQMVHSRTCTSFSTIGAPLGEKMAERGDEVGRGVDGYAHDGFYLGG